MFFGKGLWDLVPCFPSTADVQLGWDAEKFGFIHQKEALFNTILK